MTRIALIAAGLLLTTTLAASAHETRADIDAREQGQLGRIEQGRENGSITWREGLKLRAEQRRIAADEAARIAEHGHLTRHDRHELDEEQDAAAHHIHEEATDGWRRPSWLPRIGR
jgi:hypothetical protein